MTKRKLKIFAVDALTPPDGWFQGHDPATVNLIAESISAEGLREPIVVVPSGHIVHGVHRWAAATKLGLAEVECIVEPQSQSPEQHEAKVLSENVARRHLTRGELAELTAALVRSRTAQGIEAAEPAPEARFENTNNINAERSVQLISEPARAPRGTAKTQAVREVAEALGKSEAAVRMQIARVEKKQREQSIGTESPQGQQRRAPSAHDQNGEVIDGELAERYLLHRSLVDKMLSVCLGLARYIGELDKAPGYHQSARALRDSLSRLRATIKSCTPTTLCEFCNGGDAECESCHGYGFEKGR